MLSYEQALEQILSGIEPLVARSVPLSSALGRILAEDITSGVDLPPFDNSAMDGYAVIAADTTGASAQQPVNLLVIETIAAGKAPRKSVASGLASRIFTGGVVPLGADAIVPIEDTAPASKPGSVAVTLPAGVGQFLRRRGSDVTAGSTVLSAGTAIRPYEICLAAAVGRGKLRVVGQPKVAIIATGNELVDPGEALLRPGQIYSSNPYALSAQATACGAAVCGRFRAGDTIASVRKALDRAIAAGADVIVSSGGVSVGEFDVVRPAIELGGAGAIDFWRVSIRPGKPLAFGHYKGCRFFGLPGNPVSSMVTFELFVRPALRRLAGHAKELCARQTVGVTLLEDARHEVGRRSFVRAVTSAVDGKLVTRPLAGQSSHMISTMCEANSLLIVPEDVAVIEAGRPASAILLQEG